MEFDNGTSFHWDGRGDYVFDWFRNGDELPVRVEARRKFAKDVWGLDWKDRAAVKARFDQEKYNHVPSIDKAVGGSMASFRVYEIG